MYKNNKIQFSVILFFLCLPASILIAQDNLAPVVKTVIASPNSISYRQTSQLLVDANDQDNGPLPLKYKWIIPSGAGAVSNAEVSNPAYIPPEVNSPQTFTLQVEVSDGNKIAIGKVEVTVTGNIPPIISFVSASPDSIFDTLTSQLLVSAYDDDNGPYALSYNWIVPAGAGTVSSPVVTNPIYTPPKVSGAQTFRIIVNVSDGKSTIGGYVDIDVRGNVAPVINAVNARPDTIMDTQTSQLTVSAADQDNGPTALTYNWVMPQGAGSLNDYTIPGPTYIPADVDGDKVFRLTVNVSDGSETVSRTVDINVKDTYVFFASFDSNTNNFKFVSNTFRDTTAGGYARGELVKSGGYSGGALQVMLGNVDSTTVLNMSGGWQRTFNLRENGNVKLSFWYNMSESGNNEENEYGDLMASIDNVPIGSGTNDNYARTYGVRIPAYDYIDRIYGNGNGGEGISTGWRQLNYTTNLTAGLHTLTIGGYSNQKTDDSESTTILIDNVSLMTE
ncbi:MAG: hypothetical protein A2Y12_16140 [Planctomycetes bacterium GWF2_42_9]|nr:MAG: hypothetical protein A2Y12_16140 [Planctomycetes bacterium GWF2_42_9]